MNTVFLSYSRTQFYFAESLSLALQAKGIPIWMDVYQLAPGSDWEQALGQSLRSCAAFVLVASSESLASPNVAYEWRVALQRQVPIYIILYEAVTLPTELQHVAIIDMRHDFQRKVDVVADVLLHQRLHRDPLPTPQKRQWRKALDSGAALPMLFFLVGSILYAGAVVLLFLVALLGPTPLYIANMVRYGPHLGQALTILTALVPPITLGVNFLWSVSLYRSFLLRQSFWVTYFLSMLFFAPAFISALLPYFPLLWGVVIPSLIIVTAYVRREVSPRGGTLLRWLPTGAAPEWLRRRNTARWRRALPAAPRISQPRAYRLLHHPVDAALALDVRTILGKAGVLFTETPSQGVVDVLLLSRKTPTAWFEQCIAGRRTTFISIIASSVAIPLLPQYQIFYRSQWIDFRTRAREALMAAWFGVQSATARVQALPVQPESLARYQIPLRLRTGFLSVLSLYGMVVGVNLLVFFVAAFLFPGRPVIWIGGIITIALSLILNWVILRMMAGAIRFWSALSLLLLIHVAIAGFWGQISYLLPTPITFLWFLSVIYFVVLARALWYWLGRRRSQPVSGNERTYSPSTWQLVGRWLAVSLLVGIGFAGIELPVVPTILHLMPNTAYSAIAPGPQCDPGTGEWIETEDINESNFAARCASDGLVVQQKANATNLFGDYFFGSQAFADLFPRSYQVAVTITIVQPDPNLAIGIEVHGNEPFDPRVASSGNGQGFVIYGDGEWASISGVGTGASTILAHGFVSQQTSTYQVVVAVQGIQMTFSLNGQQETTVTDPIYTMTTNIGLIWTTRPGTAFHGATIEFSHFSYTPLPDPPESDAQQAAAAQANFKTAAAYQATVPGPAPCDTGTGQWQPFYIPPTIAPITCDSTGTTIAADPNMKQNNILIFSGNHGLMARDYTVSITIDMSSLSSGGVILELRLSNAGVYSYVIGKKGGWGIERDIFTHSGINATLLTHGTYSVANDASITIQATVQGAQESLTIDGNQVGSTTDGQLQQASLVAFGVYNQSAGSAIFSNFMYQPL